MADKPSKNKEPRAGKLNKKASKPKAPHVDPTNQRSGAELLAKQTARAPMPVEEAHRLDATPEQRVAARAAAAQASEYRIRAVLDAATNAIVTIDASGRIETFNRAAERIFGYTADEIIGQNVCLLMPDPYRQHHDEYLRRYRETGEAQIIGKPRELNGLRKDGTVFPLELSVSAVPELGLFTAMIRDLTTEKTLQREILQIATLEQRRIGQELHDVTQQELTGLGLLAANLADALREKDAPELHELAERLAGGIAAANLGVRALAKGLLPGNVQAESLAPALAELAETTRRQHGIDCRFEGPNAADVGDDITAMHLYRIAQEAVNNAIKHAEAGNIAIRLHVADAALELEIRDDGVGTDQPGAASRQRRGLGLRTMAQRCGLIGGELSIDRLEGGGTRVACTVPRPAKTERPQSGTIEARHSGAARPEQR